MSTVHDASTFQPSSDFKYAPPRANKSGGKSVGIQSTKDNKSLHLSTPLMMTWGVSPYENQQTGAIESYDMSLQFPREQDGNFNEDTQAFLEAMKQYEARIKADAVTNAKDWFGKSKMTPEVVDALFTPMLRYPKDKSTGEFDYTRTPTLRVKIPYYDNTFKMEIYDLDENMIFPNASNPDLTPVELIQKTQNVALVMQSGGVWFANGKFGTTWRLVQAVVQPKASILGSRKCHVKLTTSARATLQSDRDDGASHSAASSVVTATTVESSDGEDAAPASEPTPPAPKKKVVRKKKVTNA
jgi:hypothetical protein